MTTSVDKVVPKVSGTVLANPTLNPTGRGTAVGVEIVLGWFRGPEWFN
jgi:hypothetical protein